MTLKDGGNVLLLDEPTNDIDVNTLRALGETIDHFAGAVMVISRSMVYRPAGDPYSDFRRRW